MFIILCTFILGFKIFGLVHVYLMMHVYLIGKSIGCECLIITKLTFVDLTYFDAIIEEKCHVCCQ